MCERVRVRVRTIVLENNTAAMKAKIISMTQNSDTTLALIYLHKPRVDAVEHRSLDSFLRLLLGRDELTDSVSK